MQFKRRFIISIMLCFIMTVSCLGLTYGFMPKQTHANLAQSSDVSNIAISDLNFTLINDGQAYKVGAANKALTEAVIPAQYNGLPVVEVADNAFMSCVSLTRVFVPSSVKRIGNNAFMNSKKLERVVGMAGVTSYGNNAFNMCSSLENLMLPENITELGSAVIKNLSHPVYARATAQKMSMLNANWNYNGNIVYGNTIVYEDYSDSEGVSGYQIAPWQNLASSNDPLIIYSWCYYDENDTIGKPLLNIGQGAFSNFEVPSITLKHPADSNLNHTINIEAYAFTQVNAANIDIETEIKFSDPDFATSDGVFWGSKIQSVTLPDSLDALPNLMFSECINLTEIKNLNSDIKLNHLSDKILSIGAEAFDQCYSLPNLYIHGKINYIGDNAFNRWGTNPDSDKPMQNVYINTLSESSNWGTLWNNGYNKEKCNIEFTGATEYTITFEVSQSGVVDPTGNDTKIIAPKSKLEDITDLTTPISTSHDFSGVWYTTEERTPGTELAKDKEINMNMTLYAGWNIKHFDRTFIENKYLDFYDAVSGSKITGNTRKFEYGQSYQFYVLINNGYENVKISHDDQEIQPNTGNIYTINITSDATLSIEADLITYTITYDNLRSGTNPSSNPDTYTVESSTITFAEPEWEAYNKRSWDTPILPTGSYGDKTLTAEWSIPVVYSITYYNLRGGINPSTNPSTYTVETPTITFDSPEWEAYSGRTWDISSISEGSWGAKSVTAVWADPIEFQIEYKNLRGGTNPACNPTSYTVESESIEFSAPLWNAYRLCAWDKTGITSGSWGKLTVTAIWSNPTEFQINYMNLQGGINPITNPVRYSIETETIYFEDPQWDAYRNGSWNISSIPQGSWGEQFITAKWSEPVEYKVTYNNLRDGVNPSVNPIIYTVETPSITFAAPEWSAYNIGSWDIIGIPQGSWGDKTITAKWSNPVSFSIYYEMRENATNPIENPKTYTIETPTFSIKRPNGTPKTGYMYEWEQNIRVNQGTYGNLYFSVSPKPVPIYYTISCDSSLFAPSKSSIRYDESFTVQKKPGYEDGKYYIAYRRESDGENAQYIEITNQTSATLSNLTTINGDWIEIIVGEKNCVAEGTMITLADGTQIAVEDLTGNEELLVWNLMTGQYDIAPILFIDKDEAKPVEVIQLYFSDGTEVKVVYEHAFWDINLSRYVFLRQDAAQYIGHYFNKQDGNGWKAVQLIDVKIKTETVASYSPVTYGHLCYYVNGMLSMPGATEGLINIFEVDSNTMKFNGEAMAADIAKYGLLKYEEVADIMTEEVFNAFNGQYLAVSIGKGLITWDEVIDLLASYSIFF